MPERLVGDLVRGVAWVRGTAAETVSTAAKRMLDQGCESILVMDRDKLIGIFTEHDLLMRVVGPGKNPRTTHLGDVMTHEPDTIGADEPVKNALRQMDEFSYRYLPVIDGQEIIGVLAVRHMPFADVTDMQPELSERHALAERLR